MTEHLFAVLLILALLGMSLWFAWRQVQTLRWMRTQPQMMTEDRRYYRGQVYRRFVCCGLTFALGCLLIGMLAFGVMDELDKLSALGDQARKEGGQLTDEQKDFLRFSFNYVIVILLVLFTLLVVVFMDVVAIRRFGMRHRKRIRDDRKAMLMRQLPLLRRSREESEESE
jgi:hypothetical protein